MNVLRASLNIILVFLSILYAVCGLTFAFAGDDYGNSCSTARVVALNSAVSGRIERGGDHDYFRINVPERGRLRVYTTGYTDTYGYLKDGRCRTIASNDDGGVGTNFRIEREVTRGTYYVVVRHFSSRRTGSYILHVEFERAGGSTGGSAGGSTHALETFIDVLGNSIRYHFSHRYKPYLFARLSVPILDVGSVTFNTLRLGLSGEGSLEIDLADLAGLTGEGRDGWVTVWIDGGVELGFGAGSPVNAGVKFKRVMLQEPDPAKLWSINVGDLSLSLGPISLGVTGFTYSSEGFSLFDPTSLSLTPDSGDSNNDHDQNDSNSWDVDLNINLLAASMALLRLEIKRDILNHYFNEAVRAGFLLYHASGGNGSRAAQWFIDALQGMATGIRPFTRGDDGTDGIVVIKKLARVEEALNIWPPNWNARVLDDREPLRRIGNLEELFNTRRYVFYVAIKNTSNYSTDVVLRVSPPSGRWIINALDGRLEWADLIARLMMSGDRDYNVHLGPNEAKIAKFVVVPSSGLFSLSQPAQSGVMLFEVYRENGGLYGAPILLDRAPYRVSVVD